MSGIRLKGGEVPLTLPFHVNRRFLPIGLLPQRRMNR
jgi:hypothetical protein